MRPFSKPASQVLKLAHEAAQERGHGYMGTEHLLLGIIREGTSPAARILLENGATEYRIQAMVDELIGERMRESWAARGLPVSPYFIDVFVRAQRVAERLGQSQLRAEHLLIGLLRQTRSVGCEALRGLGISPETMEDALHEPVPQFCSRQ